MLTWWILVAWTWIGWGSSAESSLISRLGIPRGWRMGHLHLQKKILWYLVQKCQKARFLPVEAELYWQMRARSVSTSLSPKEPGSEGVDPGPRVPSWGSGWAAPEFELRSIWKAYLHCMPLQPTHGPIFFEKKKRVLKNVSMHTWSIILMHSAVGYFNNFRFILFNYVH